MASHWPARKACPPRRLGGRVEHGIHYVQNWTLVLDIRILLLSLWRSWLHRNAY